MAKNSKQVGGKGEPHREGKVGTPVQAAGLPTATVTLTFEKTVTYDRTFKDWDWRIAVAGLPSWLDLKWKWATKLYGTANSKQDAHAEADVAIAELIASTQAGSDSDVQCDSSNKPISSDMLDEREGRR